MRMTNYHLLGAFTKKERPDATRLGKLKCLTTGDGRILLVIRVYSSQKAKSTLIDPNLKAKHKREPKSFSNNLDVEARSEIKAYGTYLFFIPCFRSLPRIDKTILKANPKDRALFVPCHTFMKQDFLCLQLAVLEVLNFFKILCSKDSDISQEFKEGQINL